MTRTLAESAGVTILTLIMVSQAQAPITLAHLTAQAETTSAAHLQYMIARDTRDRLEGEAAAAYSRWQELTQLAIWYYGAGDYLRGDYYQVSAIGEQTTYDRLVAELRAALDDVETKWQAYCREFAQLQAMLEAYRNQG